MLAEKQEELERCGGGWGSLAGEHVGLSLRLSSHGPPSMPSSVHGRMLFSL